MLNEKELYEEAINRGIKLGLVAGMKSAINQLHGTPFQAKIPFAMPNGEQIFESKIELESEDCSIVSDAESLFEQLIYAESVVVENGKCIVKTQLNEEIVDIEIDNESFEAIVKQKKM